MRKIISFVLAALLLLGTCTVSGIKASAEEVALENLFLDATVSVSTWYPETNPPSYLNDGESSPDPSVAGTLLCTFDGNKLCYFDFTLPKAKELNQVKVCFNWEDVDYRAKDIAIDVQLENGTWVRVAEMHDAELYPDVEDFDLLFTFETVKAKVVRVTGNGARNNAPGWRVVEVEGYKNPSVTKDDYTGTKKDANDKYNIPEVTSNAGTQGGSDPEVVLDNLFLNATVTTPNWYPDTNPPSYLNDGEASPDPAVAGTVLCAFDDKNLCSFDFTLPKATKLNQVKVCFNWQDVDYRSKDIAIDVQLKDGTWVRVAEIHNASIYPDVEDFDLLFTFKTVEAKVVRITGNGARGDAPGWRVVEVESYMNPDVTKADYTGTKKDSNDAYNIPEVTSGGSSGGQGNSNGDGTQGGTNTEPVLDNLFLNATVTTPNWYPEGNPPSKLNDGEASPNPAEAGTTLCEFDGNKLCYFDVTLPKPTKLNQVKVCFNWEDVAYRAKDIAIDVQQKDGTWVRVAEMHNVKIYPDVEDFDLLFTFKTVEAKVVRITGNGTRNNAPGWRVVEVEGYMNSDVTKADYTGTKKDSNDAYNIPEVTSGGSSGGDTQGGTNTEPVLDNLFLNATVTTPNWYPESNPPSKLNDGEASPNPAEAGTTLCEFDGNKLCYFDFTFQKATDINQVKVCFNWEDVGYRAKDIAIDVQLEDGTWVRVAELHNAELYPDVEDFDLLFTFETVKAKVVRVTGNGARNEALGWRLVEVEGYMNPDVAEADYTGIEKDSNDAYNIPEVTSGNSNEGQGDSNTDDPEDGKDEPTEPETNPSEETQPETKPQTDTDNKDDVQKENNTRGVLIAMVISLVVIAAAAVGLVIFVRKKMK